MKKKAQRTSLLKDAKDLHFDLRSFVAFDQLTHVEEIQVGERSILVYANEFWTGKQRDAHAIHEISYRACYKPQLPRFFIERFCSSASVVYDPFMGRGTTLIEARLHGCEVMGNDANPIAEMLVQPRLYPPSLTEIEKRLADVSLITIHAPAPDPDLLVFFHPDTLNELHGWRAYFRQRTDDGEMDAVDRWLRMVACNRLTGHSPGFFSVYTLPPNQATSAVAQRKINEKRKQNPEYRDTKALILKKSRQLLKHPLPHQYAYRNPLLLTKSADQTSDIPDASVRLVVTSPPFLDTVDYVQDNWLRTWFCDVEIDRQRIWQIRSLEEWTKCMTRVFHELMRVLEPGGIVAFEVGEVRKGKLKLEESVIHAAASAGFTPECVMIQVQEFTKTANCWGIVNNLKGTNSNRIVVLSKP